MNTDERGCTRIFSVGSVSPPQEDYLAQRTRDRVPAIVILRIRVLLQTAAMMLKVSQRRQECKDLPCEEGKEVFWRQWVMPFLKNYRGYAVYALANLVISGSFSFFCPENLGDLGGFARFFPRARTS